MQHKKLLVLMCCIVAVAIFALQVPAHAAQETATLITTEDTTADEVLAAIDAGGYIQLGANLDLSLAGQTMEVDLAGYNLSVSGNGKIKGFILPMILTIICPVVF